MRQRIGRLHVITDAALQTRWTHLEVARQAVAGGADVVQFREKRPRSTAELVREAHDLREAVQDAAQLIVNDRVDVAAAVRAHGVHLGRQDLDIETARLLLPDRLIGGTANGLAEALQRAQQSLDYLGVGPVFGTHSKQNPAPTLGVAGLAAIVQAVACPVIAIGNITPARVAEVLDAGAYGIAVLSGVACAADPVAAAARYREQLDAHTPTLESPT